MKIRFSYFFFILLISNFLTLKSDSDDEDEYTNQFRTWKDKFLASFKTRDEETYRYSVFKTNYKKIEEHNKDTTSTFKMGVNQFTDLTYEEFAHLYLTKFPEHLKLNHEKKDSRNEFILHKHHKHNNQQKFLQTKQNRFANGLDLREMGMVTRVRNQGQCGSCAMFASIAAMEAALYQGTGYLQELSEQYLIDCAYNHYIGEWGAFGCSGAWPYSLFDYVIHRNSGFVPLLKDYPYEGRVGQCRFNDNMPQNVKGKIIDFHQYFDTSIDVILKYLDNKKPVVLTMYAGSEFGSYATGVLQAEDSAWSQPGSEYYANHAVVIVGYGKDQATGLDYFLIKNSWGSTWGEHGFAKVDATLNDAQGLVTRGYITLRFITVPTSSW